MFVLLTNPSWTVMNLSDWLGTDSKAGARALKETQAIACEHNQVCWYPSAGNCFRDLVAWEHPSLLDIPSPSVFIHTDYRGQLVESDSCSLDGGGATIEERFELKLKERLNYRINPDHASHAGLAFDAPKIELLWVSLKCHKRTMTKPVVYFYFENINWFETVVLTQGLKFTHLYKRNEGLSGGGCRTSICNLYPHLDYVGCRHLLTDPELSIEPSVLERLRVRYRHNGLWPFRWLGPERACSEGEAMYYLGLETDVEFYEACREDPSYPGLSAQPPWIRRLFSKLEALDDRHGSYLGPTQSSD